MMDRRAQSEVIGVILLLGLTIIGVTAIASIGATSVADSRHAAEVRSTEHGMTLFDSRAAKVALGDADVQAVRFGRTSGQFDVRTGEDAGTMRITHRDVSETEIWSSELIPLGAVVYTNDDTEVVYEGGGVWRRENGATVMVSPPEFHYRKETLTLPIIAVTGEGSTSGGSELFVRPGTEIRTQRIYPDGGDNRNPITEGTVTVTVESEYYEGWKRYFETRTNGEITVDEGAESVTVELQARETIGHFTMTGNGDELNLRLAEEEEDPLEEFRLTLYPNEPGEGEGGREFNPFRWGFEVSESEFELMFEKNGDHVDVVLTSPDGSETWEGEEAFAIETDANGDEFVELRLADLETTETTEVERTNGSETRSLEGLLGEYLSELGPNVDLVVFDQGQGNGNGSDRVDYETSFGYLEYDGSDQFIAYLHTTENEVEVRLS